MNTPARHFAFAVTALACLVITFDGAKSQSIDMQLHRRNVRSDDRSGWHLAVSTKGSFSVRMPVVFDDYTLMDPRENLVLHGIGGVSPEGIGFSAAEYPQMPFELLTIPEEFASDPANKVSDVKYESKNGIETMYFTAIHRAQGAHYRFSRHENTTYILSISFSNELLEHATQARDEFLQSFNLKDKNLERR